jgi:triphosphoribosyl-dephospho-CoA synthase
MAETFALRQENFRPSAASAVDGFATRIGSLAIRALYRELALSRKPGLVSPTDSGSHQDMDFHTFMRSLESLRDYFPEITRVGAASPSFEPLRQLGVAAEAKMLQATGGINTHRGAIFNIGLLCAAAGAMHAEGRRLSAADVCAEAARRWGGAIEAAANPASHSHGAEMARRYGSGGAQCPGQVGAIALGGLAQGGEVSQELVADRAAAASAARKASPTSWGRNLSPHGDLCSEPG